jgi:organic hydroperoxide reductase OsmC/OhrA
MAETVKQEVSLGRKTFVFGTTVEMTGAHSCLLSSEERVPLDISSPPEFNGEVAVWTPEHMFVGAVEACVFLTFMHFLKRRNVRITSFESTAECKVEYLDGSYRITHIMVRPSIIASPPVQREDLVNLLHEAEKKCLVSNSISAIVEVNPTIVIESS